MPTIMTFSTPSGFGQTTNEIERQTSETILQLSQTLNQFAKNRNLIMNPKENHHYNNYTNESTKLSMGISNNYQKSELNKQEKLFYSNEYIETNRSVKRNATANNNIMDISNDSNKRIKQEMNNPVINRNTKENQPNSNINLNNEIISSDFTNDNCFRTVNSLSLKKEEWKNLLIGSSNDHSLTSSNHILNDQSNSTIHHDLSSTINKFDSSSCQTNNQLSYSSSISSDIKPSQNVRQPLANNQSNQVLTSADAILQSMGILEDKKTRPTEYQGMMLRRALQSGMTGKKSDYARRVKLATELGLTECFIKNWMNNHKPKSLRKSAANLHANAHSQLLQQTSFELQHQWAKQLQIAAQLNWGQYGNPSLLSNRLNDRPYLQPYLNAHANSIHLQNQSLSYDSLNGPPPQLIPSYNNPSISQSIIPSQTSQLWNANLMNDSTLLVNHTASSPSHLLNSNTNALTARPMPQVGNVLSNLDIGIVNQPTTNFQCNQTPTLTRTSVFQPQKIGSLLSLSQSPFDSHSSNSFDLISAVDQRYLCAPVIDLYSHDQEKHELNQIKLIEEYHQSLQPATDKVNENNSIQTETSPNGSIDLTTDLNSSNLISTSFQELRFDREQSGISLSKLEKLFEHKLISRLVSCSSNSNSIDSNPNGLNSSTTEFGAENYLDEFHESQQMSHPYSPIKLTQSFQYQNSIRENNSCQKIHSNELLTQSNQSNQKTTCVN